MNDLIKIGLGLSIAVVFPFMVAFGIASFYDEPKEPFELCRQVDPNTIGAQKDQQYSDPMLNAEYKSCFEVAQSSIDLYNRNLFLVTTAVGFGAIVVGTLLFSQKMGPVGPALVFGGLFTILYGTTRSFRSLDKTWLFVELLVAFVGLIIVTYRYLKVQTKK